MYACHIHFQCFCSYSFFFSFFFITVTCSIQGFNFISINATNICMGCKFLELSSFKGCRITFKKLQKQHDPYVYEILKEQQNEYILNQCLQSPPHNGYYHYSVSVIDSKGENVSNCTIKSFVNVTNSKCNVNQIYMIHNAL